MKKKLFIISADVLSNSYTSIGILDGIWIYRIRESFRMEDTSSDHLVQTPSLKQDQLKQAVQDYAQRDYEYLHG